MEDRAVFEGTLAAARAGQRVALATVVRIKGSTPRGAGSKMLIGEDGRQLGTVGGGCGEADVLDVAREVLRTGTPQLIRVELIDDVDSWSPAVCGGVMDVFVEPVEPERRE